MAATDIQQLIIDLAAEATTSVQVVITQRQPPAVPGEPERWHIMTTAASRVVTESQCGTTEAVNVMHHLLALHYPIETLTRRRPDKTLFMCGCGEEVEPWREEACWVIDPDDPVSKAPKHYLVIDDIINDRPHRFVHAECY